MIRPGDIATADLAPTPHRADQVTTAGESYQFGDTGEFPARGLPTTIGRFTIRARLGAGAFGEVYRAYDPQLDREVALKVARPGTLDSPERVGRFRREARAAANLRHPNIVPVFDGGVDGDHHFIASGFVDGCTLEAEIAAAEGKPLQLKRAAEVTRKLAEALGYAHRQGVVHRDVKPENVLVDRAGEPLLADFGLALRSGDEAVKTQDGRVMGSPAYMSPEQAAGRSAAATAAADQYALGVMLYEMATGHRPFVGPLEVVIFNQIHVSPSPPRGVNPGVPRDLETVILKCLEKDPARRYPSCEVLAEDLRCILANEPVSARRIGQVERFGRWCKRNPVVASSVSFGVLALLIGTLVSLAQANEAKWQAKLAKDAADDAAEKKLLADENAVLATKEAKRANSNKKLADDEATEARRQTGIATEEAKKNFRQLNLFRLRAANLAFENNQVQDSRELLNEVPLENRCLAWGLLSRRLEGSDFSVYPDGGMKPGASAVAISEDGSRLVTGSAGGRVQLYDARSGKIIAELPIQSAATQCVALSGDGSRVAVGDDRTTRIWNTRTGRPVAAIPTGVVQCVAMSADGSRVLTGSRERKEVRLWDAATGIPITEFRAESPDGRLDTFISSVAISADGSRVASGGMHANVWDVRTGRRLGVYLGDATDGRRVAITKVSLSGDGSRLVGNVADTAKVWDNATGQETASLLGHTGQVSAVAISSDGTHVVTGSLDRTVRVWDAKNGKLVIGLKGHTDPVWSVGVAGDGFRIVSGSSDGTVRVWNGRNGQSPTEINSVHEPNDVQISEDGSRAVLSNSFDKPARTQLWDVRTGRLLLDIRGEVVAVSAGGSRAFLWSGDTGWVWDARTGWSARLSGDTDRVTSAAISADGTRIVTGSRDRNARVWDAETGRTVAELQGHANPVTSVAISADGAWAATEVDDRTTRVWDVSTGTARVDLNVAPRSVRGLAVTPDGTRIITRLNGMTIRMWDAKNGREHLALSTTRAAVTPDGSRVVVSLPGQSPRVQVLDGRTGEVITELRGHIDRVSSVAISSDGARVVTGMQNSATANREERIVACVWDVETGQPLVELNGHPAGVRCLTTSADGTLLITVPEVDELAPATPTLARVWDARPRNAPLAFRGHSGLVTKVAVSPDGTRVVTGSDDRTARVWDAQTGMMLAEIRGHDGPVTGVAISGDGLSVATQDGRTRRVWEATTGKPLPDMDALPIPLLSKAARHGEFLFVPVGKQLQRISVQVSQKELQHRAWAARPDPDWHLLRRRATASEGNPYGVELHRALEYRDFAILAFEAGDLGRAQAHFLEAALIRSRSSPSSLLQFAGRGLRAEYFAGKTFDRLIHTGRVETLAWRLDAVPLVPGLGRENFSARWTGWLLPPRPGAYRFEFYADDGLRVWIGGKLALDAWKAPQVATHPVIVELGREPQEIRIEYFQDFGGAGFDFRWIPPGSAGPSTTIPPDFLRPTLERCVAPEPRLVR